MHKWTVNRVLDLAIGVRLALGTRAALKLSGRDYDELHRDAWTAFERETGWTFAEVDGLLTELEEDGLALVDEQFAAFYEVVDGPVIP